MPILERKKMVTPEVTAAMVTLQFLQVSVNSITKAAMTQGMSQFAFLLFSSFLSLTLLSTLIPSSFFFSRYIRYPAITRSIIFRLFLMGLISCCLQVFTILGIKKGSPTLTSAIGDLVPAFTFLLALFSGMEKLAMKSQSSQAKIIGTLVSIGGALTLTLYKGLALNGAVTHYSIPQSPQSNWITGAAFSAAGASSLAVLLVVQTWIIKDYPSEFMVTLFTFMFGTAMIAVVSIVLERDPNAWTVRPGLELVAIVSMGVFSAFRGVLIAWACRKKGPLYTSMFAPLEMVIAVVIGVSFLGDTLYIGSVVGGIVIAIGFYAVIWGKAEEQRMAPDIKLVDSNLESSSTLEPLLLANESLDA